MYSRSSSGLFKTIYSSEYDTSSSTLIDFHKKLQTLQLHKYCGDIIFYMLFIERKCQIF